MSAIPSPFQNRLRKNWKHFRKWAQRQQLTAFRVYDRDIPEYPFSVDWYEGHVLVAEFPRKHALKTGQHALAQQQVLEAVSVELEVDVKNVFLVTRQPKVWGKQQYEPPRQGSERFEVRENGLRFWVQLGEYLDSGLFMDHRNTRQRVKTEARGKRMLNMFAYTGSFSVYAAAGGAKSTTSVDLSNTYCSWAEDNLKLNGFSGPAHRVVRADVLSWLEEQRTKGPQFDLVVLDPPSFSTSKKMDTAFNVQKDHPKLLAATLQLMTSGGVLYFSNNFTGFELDEDALRDTEWSELTPKSLPDDFQQPHIHRCWRIEKP